MNKNKRKCIVNGKLGVVTASYTHTFDVYVFKNKKTITGVNRKYVSILPKKVIHNESQLTLEL